MRKVRFEDGRFGIRRSWFFGWRFVDLRCPEFSWSPGSLYFADCKGSEERVDRVLAELTGKHTVVD